MRKIMIFLVACMPGFALMGCSLFGGVVEKVADVVDTYCTKETYNARQLYRDQINAELQAKGHSVEVQCAGDPAPVSP